MPLDITVRERVFTKYKGTFSFDRMYFAIHDFLNSKGYDVIEPLFKDKEGTYGHEVEFKIQGTKEVTDFIQYSILVSAKVEDVEEFAVNANGKDVLMTDGRLLFRLEHAKVIFDYQDNFKGNFLKLFDWSDILVFLVTGPLLKYWEFKYIGPVVGDGDGVFSVVKDALDMEGV